MLSLRQGLGLEVISGGGGDWQPSNESCLEAWWKKDTGLTLVDSGGTDYVSNWADSSSNSYDMAQATASKRPSYSGSPNNELVFPSVTSGDWLELASALTIGTGAFTLAFKIHPSFPSGTSSTSGFFLYGENPSPYTAFDFATDTDLQLKMGSSGVLTITLNAGRTFGDDYLVITRDGSDEVTLWHNGVEQTDTENTGGSASLVIKEIGFSVIKQFAGTIEEIQAYSCSNATLTNNINSYISLI
jgi:hypothetical protein